MNFDILPNPKPTPIFVVRVSKSFWADSKGVNFKISVRTVRRKSAFDLLSEDASNIGAEEVLLNIKNLLEVDDGLYYLKIVDERRDWETGYIEDYAYKLIPYTETP